MKQYDLRLEKILSPPYIEALGLRKVLSFSLIYRLNWKESSWVRAIVSQKMQFFTQTRNELLFLQNMQENTQEKIQKIHKTIKNEKINKLNKETK